MAFKYFNVKNGLVTGQILLHAGNGKIVATSANLGNLVTANFFQGDGGLLTNLSISSGTSILNGNSNVVVDANSNVRISVAGTPNVAIVSTSGIELLGNVQAVGNSNLGNSVSSNYFIGDGGLLTNISTASGSYITNGNSNVYVDANSNVRIGVSGTPNVAIFTDAGINVSGYLTTTNNITSGNANLGNAASANFFIGSGNNLSNIQASNITGTVSNANYSAFAGNVTTNAQPNITSVGTLAGLAVTGNATVTGNIILGNSGISLNGLYGNIGQILTSTGNNSAYWSNKFYVGDEPPETPNYGDIWYYVDNAEEPPIAKLYMWVTDGAGEYFYDFLPPTF